VVTVSVLLTIELPASHSLKEKRAVIRSLVERMRQRLHLSVAEVGLQDHVGRAQVGFAAVSGDIATARSLADAARRFVDDTLLGEGEVIDTAVEEWVLE
jgi:uncharacterized protein YlxP (DUF503 family)